MGNQRSIKSPPASQEGIDKIWIVMAGIFGTKWTNSMGIEPDGNAGKTWRAVMHGVTLEEIVAGLKRYADTGAIFIPAATEFKAFCKYNGMNRELIAHYCR